eukprot:scaffold4690_cov116-Cylindrotheca_fusiformis.AAC.12
MVKGLPPARQDSYPLWNDDLLSIRWSQKLDPSFTYSGVPAYRSTRTIRLQYMSNLRFTTNDR